MKDSVVSFIILFLMFFCALQNSSYAEDVRHIKCIHQIRCANFDVILVAGQSNATSRGVFRNPDLLGSSDRIWQLGRDSANYMVVPAEEPLRHVSRASGGIGFALPFARQYRDAFLEPGRSVLIVPAANGGTSVARQYSYWRPDGPGIADVRGRLSAALHEYRNARLVAILWHQGESDLGSSLDDYRRLTAQLLVGIRDEFDATRSVPIILGELAEPLRQNKPEADRINSVIREVASDIYNGGLALSEGLTTSVILRGQQVGDDMHFNAVSQVELSKRYFCAYLRIAQIKNSDGRLTYCTKYSKVKDAKIANIFYRILSWLGI